MKEELELNKVLGPSRKVLLFYCKVGFICNTVRMLGVSNLRCVAILKSNVRSMLDFYPPPPPNTSTICIFLYNGPAVPKDIWFLMFVIQ